QILSQLSCMYMNGIYQGDNTTCTPIDPCPHRDPIGACCVRDDAGQQACVLISQASCTQLNGIYYGNGSTCNPPPLPPSCVDPEKCQCASACYGRAPAYTDPAFAAFTGEVAFATQWAPVGQPVVVAIDVKNRATAPLNTNWNAAAMYSHPTWIN